MQLLSIEKNYEEIMRFCSQYCFGECKSEGSPDEKNSPQNMKNEKLHENTIIKPS
jgi:hypothetical protein